MIAHVYKPRRKNSAGKSVTARLYRGRYRLDGDFAVTETPLGTADKQVAERKLAKIIAEKEREKAGIIAPKAQCEAAKMPLIDHLADFLADLKIQGRTRIYMRQTKKRCERIFKECRWSYFKDVHQNAFVSWRSRQKDMAPKTLNEYLNAPNAFLNWCVKNERTPKNPLRNITKAEIRGKQQKRRAFTEDELNRLVAVSPKRRMIYLTAAFTGLRLNELRQLVVLDVCLDGENPHFKVRPSTTKNKKDAVVPIHSGLIDGVKEAIKGKEPGEAVFRISSYTNVGFNRDLAAAGIEKLDALGRKVDFHALRNTFATKLAKSGVPQRLAQELMRHGDPRLTSQLYTDASQLPTFDAVEGLQWNEGAKTEPQELHPQIAPQKTDFDELSLSSNDNEEEDFFALEAAGYETDNLELAEVVPETKVAEREGFEPSVAFWHVLSPYDTGFLIKSMQMAA